MASDRIQRRTETQAIIDDLHVRDSFDTLAVRAAAEIKRLAAELTTLREREAAAVPSGWRAIETYDPKKDSEFALICYESGHVTHGEYMEYLVGGPDDHQTWEPAIYPKDAADRIMMHEWPTHWMPLPEPPK